MSQLMDSPPGVVERSPTPQVSQTTSPTDTPTATTAATSLSGKGKFTGSGELYTITKLNEHLSATLTHGRLLEIELILLGFSTGILDVMTYIDYHVFVSIQTGNIVQLAVGALNVGTMPINMTNLGVVLAVFLGGGVVLGQLGTSVGPRRRGWLLATNLFQTILTGVAAVLRWKVALDFEGPGALGIIAMLAFSAGGQLALARTVNGRSLYMELCIRLTEAVPDITTVMVTAAYIDLFIDPALFRLHNAARLRRFLSICALAGGAFVGASSYKYAGGAACLGISAICKLAITGIFLMNKRVEVPPERKGNVNLGDLEERDAQREEDDVVAVPAAIGAENR